MPKKPNLPMVVHDHFRKANKLHTYVEKELGEARNHALEIGAELLAAKKAVPHREWETECKRLFDGSLRSARFYMAFARDFGKLKTAGKAAVLMLEGTLEGAAKAARAANPKPPSKPKSPPPPVPPIDVDSEPVDKTPDAPETPEDYGKCPACLGTKWKTTDDGVVCCKCTQPHGEPAGDPSMAHVDTQRAKLIKTLEAAMRAVDDLQGMLSKPWHKEFITKNKELITLARKWK